MGCCGLSLTRAHQARRSDSFLAGALGRGAWCAVRDAARSQHQLAVGPQTTPPPSADTAQAAPVAPPKARFTGDTVFDDRLPPQLAQPATRPSATAGDEHVAVNGDAGCAGPVTDPLADPVGEAWEDTSPADGGPPDGAGGGQVVADTMQVRPQCHCIDVRLYVVAITECTRLLVFRAGPCWRRRRHQDGA